MDPKVAVIDNEDVGIVPGDLVVDLDVDLDVPSLWRVSTYRPCSKTFTSGQPGAMS